VQLASPDEVGKEEAGRVHRIRGAEKKTDLLPQSRVWEEVHSGEEGDQQHIREVGVASVAKPFHDQEICKV